MFVFGNFLLIKKCSCIILGFDETKYGIARIGLYCIFIKSHFKNVFRNPE